MSRSESNLSEAMRERVLLLDGATGTELTRRGVATPLPIWSAAALTSDPEVVAAIHGDYVAAGADIIVANTFRTNVRTLRRADLYEHGERLNRVAVELAREAMNQWLGDAAREGEAPAEPGPTGASQSQTATHPMMGHVYPGWIAASVSPVEDCYHPELVPDESQLFDEHAEMMAWLSAAKPDLVWIETMNTVREARAAARAAFERGLCAAVSFVVREDGDLLSGEPLEEAVESVEPFDPIAIGLNCIPPVGVVRTLPRLRRATDRPLAAYAHIGNPDPICGWSFSQDVTPEEYAEHARRWLDYGVRIVGGCCGTTPPYTRALRQLIDEDM